MRLIIRRTLSCGDIISDSEKGDEANEHEDDEDMRMKIMIRMKLMKVSLVEDENPEEWGGGGEAEEEVYEEQKGSMWWLQ